MNDIIYGTLFTDQQRRCRQKEWGLYVIETLGIS